MLKFSVLRPFPINRHFCRKKSHSAPKATSPDLDLNYLCHPDNYEELKRRIVGRKSDCDIALVLKLNEELLDGTNSNPEEARRKLLKEALKIPNKSHPRVLSLNDTPDVIKTIGEEKNFSFKPRTFEAIANKLRLIKTENISNLTGTRSYYLLDQLAELEQALIQYSLSKLRKEGFRMISVPDVLPKYVIDYCGLNTEGERTQVYKFESKSLGEDLCLSGTAEMGIASYLENREFKSEELPLRLCSVSRCFRAETSKISEEKGLYRVHQFTKVEMFGVTENGKSEALLDEFMKFEESTFAELGLHLRVLDMPECELGNQAYRKYDIEAYMPGKQKWGEISSTSDCIDFQTRRLNIKCDGQHAHTINGTACAVPRMIISLMETHQKKDGTVDMPDALVPFLGYKTIVKSKLPQFKAYKMK